RNRIINLRLFLIYEMFRAQELLKLIDIIDSEIIKLDSIFPISIWLHIQFISHKRTFQHSKMLNAPN
ncbi:MAG: hypothetical protein K2G40_01025, partial [Muribaculaceae bacterium]|nr:hypothetical protein [Muribaculaceae bacterium]